MRKLIEFDRETHTYTVDGTVVPCVSEIIAPLGDDLEPESDLELVLDAAAERGTVLHKVLELLLSDIDEDDIEYPDEYEPYVDAIRLFLAEHSIEPYAIEKPVFCKRYGYAGTPDLFCEFDGRLALLDYKFVAQVAKSKVKAQLNAYLAAYEEQGIYLDNMYVVQFLKDGTYRLYPVAYGVEELEICLKFREIKYRKHPRGKIA